MSVVIRIVISPTIIIRASRYARSGSGYNPRSYVIIFTIRSSASTSSYSGYAPRSQRPTYDGLSFSHKAQAVIKYQGSKRYSEGQNRLR